MVRLADSVPREGGIRVAAAVLFVAALALPAHAAIQRTFVAGSGDDANACTINAPCRSFAAAIAQTLPGGELLVQDSAGYGPVIVTQSVSIIAPEGIYAGITVSSGADGVVVDGPGVRVDLRGLSINGLAGSRYGIWFKTGATLEVAHTKVTGMQVGLYQQAISTATIVRDSHFARNSAVGIWFRKSFNVVRNTVIQRNGSLSAGDAGLRMDGHGDLSLVNVTSSQNLGDGIAADSTTATATMKVTIDESQFFGNTGTGVFIRSNDPEFLFAQLTRSTSVGNGGDGLRVEGNTPPVSFSNASVTATECTFSTNLAGVRLFGQGVFVVLSGNTIHNNTSWAIHTGTPLTTVFSRGDNVVFPDNVGGLPIQPAPKH